MYRAEVGVYVFSLIQLARVLLWLLCERSGNGVSVVIVPWMSQMYYKCLYMCTLLWVIMYRAEVRVYVFSLIQLARVLLWLLCERSGNGVSVVIVPWMSQMYYKCLYMCTLLWVIMYRAEVGVYVFSLIQLAWVLLWLLCGCRGYQMGVVIVPWTSPV